MPRAKGSKLTDEHKALLKKRALEHHQKIRELKENVGKNATNNNKKDAGQNGESENNISGHESDNRIHREPETLEIEKGVLKDMEIPPKETETKPESFTCGSCKNEITMGVKFCPHCGCQLDWSVAN